MSKLRLKNVTKFYKNNKVLDNISLEIEENKFVLFVGENGSGKSTTIKLITGIVPFKKNDSGEIENDFGSVCYLPEKYTLPKSCSTLQFIMTYTNQLDKEFVLRHMLRYGIPNKWMGALSKGMMQKVGLLSTVLKTSEITIFDEPLDGLDDASKKVFKIDIARLISEGRSVIIATHHRQFYKEIDAVVFRFSQGRIGKR